MPLNQSKLILFPLQRNSLWSLLIVLICWQLWAKPVEACLSCACGSSGAGSDLGTMAGGASLFSGGRHWLLQTGFSGQNILGSFNETGHWNPLPTHASLHSFSGTLGLIYFPSQDLSFGMTVPVQVNLLNQVSWGPFGSLNPTDSGLTLGSGWADVQFQASYSFWDADQIGTALWTNVSVPTGQVSSEQPAQNTGSGIATASAGVMAVYRSRPRFQVAEQNGLAWLRSRDWEFIVNLGYAQALGAPPLEISPFFLGQSVLYQLQSNVILSPQWLLGLGLSGQAGLWSAGQNQWQAARKIKIQPSIQYEFSMNQGLRLAIGADLPWFGANQTSVITSSLVYYQFFD